MLIYITGIDGSGKSTIIEHIREQLSSNKQVYVFWARYEPKMLKFPLRLFRKRIVKNSVNYNDMTEVQYILWKRFKRKILKINFLNKIIFILQYFDYILQLIRIEKQIGKCRGGIVFLDRYLLDFIVDQSINYGNISKSIITKTILNKLRKLDFIFYISVSPEVAMKRKSDIPSIQYLIDRDSVYKKYIQQLSNCKTVDNDTEDVSAAINKIMTLIN